MGSCPNLYQAKSAIFVKMAQILVLKFLKIDPLLKLPHQKHIRKTIVAQTAFRTIVKHVQFLIGFCRIQ